MLCHRSREEFSSSTCIFGFQQDFTIVSYVPKRGKAVVLLSSSHHSLEIDTEPPFKPEIITDYNQCKAGVDTLDQNVRCYSSKRKTRRWPFALFRNLIDISAYNAYMYVLFTQIHPQFAAGASHRRRIFLIELATLLLPLSPPPALPVDALPRRHASHVRRRCFACPRNLDRKTVMRCTACNLHLCENHSERRCNNCI